MSKVHPLTVYLPDQRDITISRYGYGNSKLGPGVFTYSRLAGCEVGTCPGSTEECEDICYAKRIDGPVLKIYAENSLEPVNEAWAAAYGQRELVPPIPKECHVLRLHVSGDFDSVEYIKQWIARLKERPYVDTWAYTKSWRVPGLLGALEELRALPNVQLFASMDPSSQDMPPKGWRRAWIWRDIEGKWPMEKRLAAQLFTSIPSQVMHAMDVTSFGDKARVFLGVAHNMTVIDAAHTPAYVCPEETGRKRNCMECGYCIVGKKHDVVFLEH